MATKREWLISWDRLHKAIGRYDAMVRQGDVERPALMDCIIGARDPEHESQSDERLAKRYGI